MLRFETYTLNEAVPTYDDFREEKIVTKPLRDIEVKVAHKESINIETGFDGRVNSYNGFTLDKEVAVGNILTRGGDKLRIVWVDHVPRLSTMILEGV